MPDKLYFYSKSRDVAPGRGTNEHVEDPDEYTTLEQIPDWRKILSNFSADGIVEFGGRSYRTVEHVFQAEKIRMVDPGAAFTFCLESGSALSKGSGADAQKQRKLRRLNAEQLELWDSRQISVLKRAWRFKVQHCPLFREVVRRTQDAQLWHIQSRKPAVRWVSLERVRDQAFP